MQILTLAAVASFAVGCASNECKLNDPTSCPTEQTCEVVQGRDKPMCFAPVQIQGKVFDLDTSAGIAKAEVTALDADGSPVGTVATSATDGTYTLRVPSTRTDDKGTFVSRKLTLRAQATNYAPFPSGVRVSLPVDTTAAARTEPSKPFVLANTQTDVGLSALPAAQQNRSSISGTVEVAAGQKGVLVVAESGANPGVTAIADEQGAFHLFNVAPGTYQLQAYSRGSSYTAQSVTVEAGKDTTGVQLKKSTAPTGTVSGTVQLVAGANGAGTSIVLVVESTFNSALTRGEVPPGLRAPDPGTAPNITNGFSITGVPDGKYVVLAAFENDGNVRDPDPSIAGTQIQHITVSGGTPSVQPSFKVTGAVNMVGPGAGDAVEAVTGTPTFTWTPYPSTHSYDLVVFDSVGVQVWNKLDVPNTRDASGNIVAPYAGPALAAGRVYQWRVTAKDNSGNPLSSTEDLRGVFTVK